jgi:hypothetical protein
LKQSNRHDDDIISALHNERGRNQGGKRISESGERPPFTFLPSNVRANTQSLAKSSVWTHRASPQYGNCKFSNVCFQVLAVLASTLALASASPVSPYSPPAYPQPSYAHAAYPAPAPYHAAPAYQPAYKPAYKPHAYAPEYEAPAKYDFAYEVADSYTGDYKSQTENRDGDYVKVTCTVFLRRSVQRVRI